MSLTIPPDAAERHAAQARLPEVREQAASRRRRRRGAASAAAVMCLVIVAGVFILSEPTSVRITVGSQPTSADGWPSPTPPVFRSYKPEAQAILDHLQAAFVPPPGATLRTGPPPAGLDHAATGIGPGALLTSHRLWTVPGSPQAAIAFLQANLVPGAVQGDSGANPSNSQALWFDQDFAGGVVHGVITPEVVASGSGDTAILRVDFQVAYSPARPKGEEVTVADRYVSVSSPAQEGPTPSPARQVTFTDPATVVSLANAFNALTATSSSGTLSCPPPKVSYTISFGPSATSPPDFIAQGPGCGGWYVTWGVKGTGELQASATLNALLSSLVGP